METESFKLDVHVQALSQDQSLGFVSTVLISQYREVEEFLINEKDDTVTSLGSYPEDSSTSHDPLISLKLPSFKPNDVYQRLQTHLHDHDLSEQISYKIVQAQQRQKRQSFYLPQQRPLFMIVSVKLTHKVYNVVSCDSAPLATDFDQESQQEEEEESKTCAICLENLLRSEDYCEMPTCSHYFHEPCLTEWLTRDNNSCPLCRKPVDKLHS
ncbi:putative chromatin regulator PHD family [Arabidopsis thaliana]